MRTKVSGTTERPRLCVYRSLGHIYAQVIDDRTGKTLVSASSVDKETKKNLKGGGNIAAAFRALSSNRREALPPVRTRPLGDCGGGGSPTRHS